MLIFVCLHFVPARVNVVVLSMCVMAAAAAAAAAMVIDGDLYTLEELLQQEALYCMSETLLIEQ